jgi:hypothetical protein
VRERIENIRMELRHMEYRRLTDTELAELVDLDLDAKANNAIEGLHATAAEDAYFRMMNEERAPTELRARFAAQFVTGSKP